MLRATPVIKPETALSTGYVVVVAALEVLPTLVLMAPDRDVNTEDTDDDFNDDDDDDDDDKPLMVNNENTFANDLEVAKLERLK